jgi:hypothetical protein
VDQGGKAGLRRGPLVLKSGQITPIADLPLMPVAREAVAMRGNATPSVEAEIELAPESAEDGPAARSDEPAATRQKPAASPSVDSAMQQRLHELGQALRQNLDNVFATQPDEDDSDNDDNDDEQDADDSAAAGTAKPAPAWPRWDDTLPAIREGDYDTVMLAVELVPGLGTTPTSAKDRKIMKRLSLNVLYGESDVVSGIELGVINRSKDGVVGVQWGAVNLDDGLLWGAQLSPALNYLGGGGRGAQLSAALNVAKGRLRGAQLTSGINILQSDSALLAQLAGGANIAAGNVRGTQVAGGFNILAGAAEPMFQASGGFNLAARGLRGVQATGGFNFGGDIQGLQIAGGFNLARGLRGAQVSGGFNVAGATDGAQVSVLNVSGDVDGAQVGVVNIAWGEVRGSQVGVLNIAAEYAAGIPVGLVNIVRDGQWHVDVWASDLFFFNTSFKFGSRNFYTIANVAMSPDEGQRPSRVAVGLGFGGTVNFGDHVYIAFDGIVHEADLRVRRFDKMRLFCEDKELLLQSRLMLGAKLYEHLGAFVGLSANLYFAIGRPLDHDIARLKDANDAGAAVAPNVGMRLFPGFVAGITL